MPRRPHSADGGASLAKTAQTDQRHRQWQAACVETTAIGWRSTANRWNHNAPACIDNKRCAKAKPYSNECMNGAEISMLVKQVIYTTSSDYSG